MKTESTGHDLKAVGKKAGSEYTGYTECHKRSEYLIDPEMTLYGAVRHISLLFPERNALDFTGRMTTYGELIKNVDAISDSLAGLGVAAGDRVALCLPNCPLLVEAVFALNRIGAAAVMQNPLSAPAELSEQLSATGCKGLLIFDLFLRKINFPAIEKLDFVIYASLAPEMKRLKAAAYIAATASRSVKTSAYVRRLKARLCRLKIMRPLIISRSDFLSACKNKDACADNTPAADVGADALIFFSGGTSGIPKPVRHSSYTINLSAIQCLETEPPIEAETSMLTVLPVFHIFGFVVALHLALITGSLSILLPRFGLESTARLIIKRKPTYMAGVPLIYEALLASRSIRNAAASGRLDFSQFRIGFCGGETLDEISLRRFNGLISSNGGTGHILNGYGLTECCPVTVMPRDGSGPEGSIGRSIPGIKIRISSPCISGCEPDSLQPFETGEICVSANSMMSGYLEEAHKHNAFKSAGGWLRTGDTGWLDEEGFLFFSHRLRRIIKVSGYTVFAGDVEKVLMSCKYVEKACVAAHDDSRKGQKIKAYVVLRHGVTQKKAGNELNAVCRRDLSPWAVPYEIEYRDELPVNHLGKISWGRLT